MKKLYTFVLLLTITLTAQAQLNGSGYYRFHNAQYTSDYISITNDKFNYLTAISTACGGLGQAMSSAGQARAMECAAKYLSTDIHMVSDDACINPGSVVFAEKKNNNSSNYEYNLIGQGTSLLTLTTGLYDGTLDLIFKDLYITIKKSSGSDASTLYTAAIQLKASNNSMADLGTRYFVDNEGTFAINSSNGSKNAKWYIEPVTHFNVSPQVAFGGKYYTTLYVPYAFTLSGQVENAYVMTGINDNGSLVITKIASKGETVPAGTPVILECASDLATECQLIPTGTPLYTTPQQVSNTDAPKATTATNYTGTNILKGTYFCNQDGNLTFTKPSGTGTINANNYTATTNPQKYVLGKIASGKLGFVKATGTAMPANKAWLEYTGSANLVLPFYIRGDVISDGVVQIDDLTALVDIVLGKATLTNNPNNYDFNAADANESGSIDVTDVTELVNIILKNNSSNQ